MSLQFPYFCSDPKLHLLLFYSHIIVEELTCLSILRFMVWQGTILKSISLQRPCGGLCTQHNTHLNPANSSTLYITQHKQRQPWRRWSQQPEAEAEENLLGGCLPCNEKAANSTAVSNGHSNLKIQTWWSQPQSKGEQICAYKVILRYAAVNMQDITYFPLRMSCFNCNTNRYLKDKDDNTSKQGEETWQTLVVWWKMMKKWKLSWRHETGKQKMWCV